METDVAACAAFSLWPPFSCLANASLLQVLTPEHIAACVPRHKVCATSDVYSVLYLCCIAAAAACRQELPKLKDRPLEARHSAALLGNRRPSDKSPCHACRLELLKLQDQTLEAKLAQKREEEQEDASWSAQPDYAYTVDHSMPWTVPSQLLTAEEEVSTVLLGQLTSPEPSTCCTVI